MPVVKDHRYTHFTFSLVKSAVRIIAGLCLACGSIAAAGCAFIIAEVLGVLEEVV